MKNLGMKHMDSQKTHETGLVGHSTGLQTGRSSVREQDRQTMINYYKMMIKREPRVNLWKELLEELV